MTIKAIETFLEIVAFPMLLKERWMALKTPPDMDSVSRLQMFLVSSETLNTYLTVRNATEMPSEPISEEEFDMILNVTKDGLYSLCDDRQLALRMLNIFYDTDALKRLQMQIDLWVQEEGSVWSGMREFTEDNPGEWMADYPDYQPPKDPRDWDWPIDNLATTILMCGGTNNFVGFSMLESKISSLYTRWNNLALDCNEVFKKCQDYYQSQKGSVGGFSILEREFKILLGENKYQIDQQYNSYYQVSKSIEKVISENVFLQEVQYHTSELARAKISNDDMGLIIDKECTLERNINENEKGSFDLIRTHFFDDLSNRMEIANYIKDLMYFKLACNEWLIECEVLDQGNKINWLFPRLKNLRDRGGRYSRINKKGEVSDETIWTAMKTGNPTVLLQKLNISTQEIKSNLQHCRELDTELKITKQAVNELREKYLSVEKKYGYHGKIIRGIESAYPAENAHVKVLYMSSLKRKSKKTHSKQERKTEKKQGIPMTIKHRTVNEATLRKELLQKKRA